MPSYLCYFLDDEDRVRAKTDIEAATLSDAIKKAIEALSTGAPRYHSVEIWQGTKLLYRDRGDERI